MTLVVSIGTTILGGSLLGAGAAGTGVLAGATLSGVASGLGTGAAIAAGTVGAGTLGAVGAGINEAVESADAADAAAKADVARGVANQPKLAAGLTPAQAPGAAAAAAANPLAGIGSDQPIQGAAEGGIMRAKGGHIPLKDGAYVIPADVVSALGNGSTKAGGAFLRQLIEAVKDESTKRHGLGAVHKAA